MKRTVGEPARRAFAALLLLLNCMNLSAQIDSTKQSVLLLTEGSHQTDDSPQSGPSPDTTIIHPVRLAIVTGTVGVTIAAIHIYQANGWWKDNRRSFHFQEDLKYGLYVDKLGHFYGATVGTFLLRKSFEWAGLSQQAALWWGAGGSLLFQTYVEIEDGFSTWGFDRVDFAANLLGASWPVAQYYSPFLQNFDFKFSYHPSPALNNPGGAGFQGQRHIMFDDYEGQTLWLSMNVHNFLPTAVQHFWPEFLSLAVGYGARDVLGKKPYSVVLLALDLDTRKLIPDSTPFLKLLGEALNFIKFPAPAVRISPGTVWYGIYF
ncbi:MAG: DUF2279 domain-containing protein [Bacteroidetes bacterium]|nr:DUF2279 domain-containing protein [Bacteroidota bacterium]MCW5896256.1 DUF2279 domain-containing protein [Bacteroidota bacterium]